MYFYNKGERYYDKARRNIQRASGSGVYVDAAILQQLGLRSDPTDFKGMVLRENYSKMTTRTRSAKSPLLTKADTLFQNRQLNAAAEMYANCIQLDSTNLAAFGRLGECYREMGWQEEAVAIYRLANRKFPQEIKFTLLLARELIRNGHTEESILTYQRAIRLDRKNLKAYYGACLGLAHKGEYRKALDLWLSGKKHLPQYKTESQFLEGVLSYHLGYYHVAVPALDNESLNSNSISKYYLAMSYHFLKDHEDSAAGNMLDAIKLGAIVSSETVTLVGLDPAVHRSY
jgi:tetratricopeptide (TPR) repeat protein